MQTISFSQAMSFTTCPKRWAFRYVDKLEGIKSEALVYGSAVHTEIEAYLLDPKLDSEYGEYAADVIGTAATVAAATLSVEVEVYKDLDGLRVHGFVDAMMEYEEDGGKILIDWKTSAKKPIEMKDDHYRQLSLYAYLADAREGDGLLVCYPQYEKGFSAEYVPEHGEEVFDFLVQTADRIKYLREHISSGNEVDGTPSWFGCTYCDFEKDCSDSYNKAKKRLKRK